jgi:dethiobiotin synthetase
MRLLVVTGTGTGIGKTIVTAALAACALAAGQQVAVVKPIQTGVLPDEPGDLAEVRRLTGLADLHEYVRYAEPLAPATAARRLGLPGPDLAELAGGISELRDRDLVIVEGAGGVLVRFNERGEGICSLALALDVRPPEMVLVVSSGLGALHDAAAAELCTRGFLRRHLIIGDWPAEPGLAERCNLTDLTGYTDLPLAGVLPHGAGSLSSAEFAELALRSVTPLLGGNFDAPNFVAGNSAPTPRDEGHR